MKVSITAESRKIITIEEMPIVRKMIESLKEDESTAKTYAAMAARIAFDRCYSNPTVYEAKANIAKNCRVYDAYIEGSANLDVWVDFVAQAEEWFVIGGAYLTDIWEISADNKEEIRARMFLRKFREV